MTFSFLRNKVYGPITKYFPSGTWIYYSRRGGDNHIWDSEFTKANYNNSRVIIILYVCWDQDHIFRFSQHNHSFAHSTTYLHW
ncbi:hypothetical protein NC651_018972 [Populus alba x Populus x berolinensis]|nr:hypothetical protein NC651_018972 [Populus alba x Populus x berolinensis]